MVLSCVPSARATSLDYRGIFLPPSLDPLVSCGTHAAAHVACWFLGVAKSEHAVASPGGDPHRNAELGCYRHRCE